MEIEKRKKEVCRYCDSGGKIEKPHTYREGCRKYVPGATKLEMEHAARGGEVGRKKLLERLGIREDRRAPVQRGQDQKRKERDKAEDQRTPVLRGRDQKRKEREKTEVKEQNEAARMSSPMTRQKRPPLKVGNKKKSREAAPQSPMEGESSPDMVDVIIGKAEERRPRQEKRKEERTTTDWEHRSLHLQCKQESRLLSRQGFLQSCSNNAPRKSANASRGLSSKIGRVQRKSTSKQENSCKKGKKPESRMKSTRRRKTKTTGKSQNRKKRRKRGWHSSH